MADPNVYPVAAAFQKFLEASFAEVGRKLSTEEPLYKVADMMYQNVLEYEHGTAEAEDVFDFPELEETKIGLGEVGSRDLMLRMYVAVCEDLIQSMLYTG